MGAIEGTTQHEFNSGVGYQPWLENNPDSTLIYINKADPESYKAYVNQMNATLFSQLLMKS